MELKSVKKSLVNVQSVAPTVNAPVLSISADVLNTIIDSFDSYGSLDDAEVEFLMAVAQYSNLDVAGIRKTAITAFLQLPNDVIAKAIGVTVDVIKDLKVNNPKKYCKRCSELCYSIFLQRGNNLAKAQTRGTDALKRFAIEFALRLPQSSLVIDSKTGARKFKPASALSSTDFTFARWASVNPLQMICFSATATGLQRARILVNEDQLSDEAARLPKYMRILSIATTIPKEYESAYVSFVRSAAAVITPRDIGVSDEAHALKVKDMADRSEEITLSLFKIKEETDAKSAARSAEELYNRAVLTRIANERRREDEANLATKTEGQ